MNVHELLNHIDTFAPFSLAEEWDNPGLMVGDYNAEVKCVGICLDAVREAVISASKNDCEVLLCHHPLIFRPVKKIDVNAEPGCTISEAIRRNVNIIAAHTNWDRADDGVNTTLAELINLQKLEPLNDEGFGFCGVMSKKLALSEFLELVKLSWGLSRLDCYVSDGDYERKILRVALCGGSGAEFWGAARIHSADIYITADMKYHELMDANGSGLTIAIADHGEMERASLSKLAEKISAFGVEAVLLDVRALSKPLRI